MTRQAGQGKQSGQGKIGCALWILAFVVAGMVAFKMVPVKVKTSELHTFMIDQAKWAGNLTNEALKKNIIGKGLELGLPLDDKSVTVQKDRDHVRMEAVYTVPVEFPGYTYNWQFHELVDRNIYIF
ncbi:MAG TPA: hypothetical protein VGS57_00770 [Thermoanaerobaculia bacterium]|jgi:hypothetical protein|nr:hypothetical protein [Thermoanaerobaculia bacterium]